MATNNLAGIPGFDASLPGGWTGTQNLTNRWGDVQANSDGSLTLTSSGADAGAMQSGAGNGYGLYSFDLSSHPGDVPGMYALLWPQNDQWPGPELDTVEVLPGGQAYSTVHHNSGGSDAYESQYLGDTNVAGRHVYSTAWMPNSITNYVDGQQQNQFTNNVPTDAAHGGMNELAGVGEQTWWSQDLQHGPNSLTLYNVQYAPPEDTVIG